MCQPTKGDTSYIAFEQRTYKKNVHENVYKNVLFMASCSKVYLQQKVIQASCCQVLEKKTEADTVAS